ncbi:MAG TPA: helix-turn-helix domain-containing protein [Stellaceae bacterium]|nr:helix-turn-helix domain-containing protein [Stellaceae bacterium]
MTPEPRRPRRRTAKEHGPDPVDVHVGRQMRLARELAGLTQVEVGRRLAMSFQVIQKYEQGEIRVSASRLFQLAHLFERPVAYFFAGFSEEGVPPAESEEYGRRDLELVRAFRAISSREVQQRLLQLVRGLIERQERDAGTRVDSVPDDKE